MKDRIRMIMESQQMSQQEFAKKLGISAASLSSIFTGRTNPTNNHVRAIHRAFPAINIEWLMFGDGTMLSSAANDADSAGGVMPDRFSDTTPIPANASFEAKDTGNDFLDGDLFSQVAAVPKTKAEPKVAEEPKIMRRAVKEIRVFYDDGTYESFVPGI